MVSFNADKLLVQPDAGLYHFINQGCLGVDNIDDKEEMVLVDVCTAWSPVHPLPHSVLFCLSAARTECRRDAMTISEA